jgi:pyridoxine/pyridoxamine 5'-phosphate oxidase
MRAHRWAIEATSSPGNEPQAAIIGIAVTEELELVFDTLASSRKAANLRANPRIALVIGGWNDADPRTVQYQGVADFPVAPRWSSSRKLLRRVPGWSNAPVLAGNHLRARQTPVGTLQRLHRRAAPICERQLRWR